MIISINVEAAFSNPTGMGRHARELLRSLMATDRSNEYTLFHSNLYRWPPDPFLTKLPDNFRVVRLPFSRKTMLLTWLCNRNLGSTTRSVGRQGIYHDFGWVLYGVNARRTIGSLHDLAVMQFPESFQWHSKLLFRRAVDKLRAADRIITVSHFAKEQISGYLGISADRVCVLYNAVSEAFRPTSNQKSEPTALKYRLPRNYLAFCGNINRRKNLPLLIRAFGLYVERNPGNDLELVICGHPGVGHVDVLNQIHTLDLSGRVKLLGHVSDEELSHILGRARAFVFPSLNEGFGIPVLEAMACGTPVICANKTALPEVAGDAAIYVTGTDAEELSSAIDKVLSDSDLRDELRKRGLQRAALFSWQNAATQLLSAYQSLS